MGWVTIHTPDGTLLFEEGREQNPHKKPDREENGHGEEIIIYPIERTNDKR